MKKSTIVYIFCFLMSTQIVIEARGFRVAQIPNGSKFSCNTCHTNGGGTPRNDFGVLVKNSFLVEENGQFNVAWGPSLATQDADGDGFTNGQELQDPNGEWKIGDPAPGDFSLVTKPGDASDFPAITSVTEENKVPNTFIVNQNYPNPFNPTTLITFNLVEAVDVSVQIFDVLGNEISTLVDQKMSSGLHQIEFIANNLRSGTYLYRVQAGNNSEVKKMVLLK